MRSISVPPLKPSNSKTLKHELLKIPMTFYTDTFPINNIITLASGKRTRGGFMHRCSSGLLLTLVITFVVALTGCLGTSSSTSGNGGVSSVSLSPGSSVSIDVGTSQVFSATGKNASGSTVLGVNIQYVVGVPQGITTPPPLSIANNGNACAGTWDASVAICSPGTPGIALVTAVINGISSPPTTVYVHQHIDSIQIVQTQTPPYQYDCYSQGTTWQFRGIAYSGTSDISDTVGPMNWSSSNTGVVTTTSIVTGLPTNPVFLVQTTAKSPGITQLVASVSGTSSNPYPYTTCLIKAIYLQIGGQGLAGNSINVNNGSGVTVTATAVDTLYGIANNKPLVTPPLTWSTTNPEVAGFSTVTNTTGTNNATARNNLGGATITASCTPPSCNIGLPGITPATGTPSAAIVPGLPIYASEGVLPNGTPGYGTISVDVTLSATGTAPTYSAWAATTGCQNVVGCTSALFAIAPGINPVGAIVSLPRTPNSIMFNHVASPRLYIGTDQGLMYVNTTGSSISAILVSSASTPCNVTLCGKVLAISNDGNQVVVSDTISTPNQVYIYNGSSTATGAPVDLIIPDETITAAAFSPDQLKLFLLTNTGNMYVYSTVDALTSVSTVTSGTDVKFSADGSFAYVAGATAANMVTAYSTCSTPTAASTNIASVTTSNPPLEIFPSPVTQVDAQGLTQNIIALEPPNVEILTASQFTQNPLLYNEFTCNPLIPPILPPANFTKGASYNLGAVNLTPLYAQLVNNGTELVVIGQNIPAVIIFNVSNGTTSSVPLARQGFGSSLPLSAASSTDGSQVFVAACDQYGQNGVCAVGSIHIINTVTQVDYQQVPYVNASDNNDTNMCNNGGNPVTQCLPNMVAIKPQ
jgi:hypothetical protein